jgi:uncharacterized membrane protein YkvA (DUF1232 family)
VTGLRARLKTRLRELRNEVYALVIVARDPRTPWYAKAVIALTVGLAASPIDPVPDFVPVLGYLDDLVFVPAGAWLALRLTPDGVLEEARARAEAGEIDARTRWLVAAFVLLGWALLGYVALHVVRGFSFAGS